MEPFVKTPRLQKLAIDKGSVVSLSEVAVQCEAKPYVVPVNRCEWIPT